MKRENRTKDVIIQLIATVFLATSGIFVRHITLAPLNVGFWRILFSMFLLYPFVRKNLKNLSKKDWGLLILSGADWDLARASRCILIKHMVVALYLCNTGSADNIH